MMNDPSEMVRQAGSKNVCAWRKKHRDGVGPKNAVLSNGKRLPHQRSQSLQLHKGELGGETSNILLFSSLFGEDSHFD